MLGHWPDLYPGETVYSGCGRFASRMGTRSHRKALTELFGAARISDPADFPCNLAHLVSSIPAAFEVTPHELIWEHTILPFFQPFFGSTLVEKIATEMLDTLAENYTKRLRGPSTQPQYLRYCPCCVEEDRRTYEETYWHRLHQLACVYVCTKHGVFLNDSTVQRAVMTPWYVIPAEQAVCAATPVRPLDPRQPYTAVLIWLAHRSQWLLEQERACWEREGLCRRYHYHLSLAGCCGQQDQISVGVLQEQFAERLPQFPRSADALNDKKNLYGNLFRLVTTGSGQPSLHLLLIWMLGLSVEQFLNGNCEYFEPGPWPCLHPLCSYPKSNEIVTYEKQQNREGTVFGVFSCRCGFVYLRRAPDIQGTSRFSPATILEPALESASARARFGARRYTIGSIAQTIGISTESAKKLVRKLHLRLKKQTTSGWPSRSLRSKVDMETTRMRYRAELLKILEENPGCSRNDLKKSLFPRGLAWLRRNDDEWLQNALPPIRRVTSSIDWHQRDVELSRRVADAKRQVLHEEGHFTRRITAQRIIRALGFSVGLQDPERLPITVSAINSAVETSRECTIRRIAHLIAAAGSPNQQWTFFGFTRMCRLPKRWRADVAIVQELANAVSAGYLRNVPPEVFEILRPFKPAKDRVA